jgi:hypothetical protein
MTRVLLSCWLALLALASMSAPAAADVFGEISLVSAGFLAAEGDGGPLQQALYAHDSAISGNGQYVAFDGYFGGLSGVWRRDLQTGEVQPVAVGAEVPGTERCVSEQEPCHAVLPSISEDGQYVSFTTNAPLEPADDKNDAPDVYVRNMNVPESQPCAEEAALHPRQPCAYTLVSAVNGGAEALTYEGEGSTYYGSIASGRSAMSADGQKVAFVTIAVSNLVGPGTPALQVAVRNLTTGETELVSTEYEPSTGFAVPDRPVSTIEGSVIHGAVYEPEEKPAFPSSFDQRAYKLPPPVGASISADGSTVAWMGTSIYKQARMLAGEDVPPYLAYTEPLWRRIEAGPLAPTRRVSGGSEPENPECLASGERVLPLESISTSDPCQGPFVAESGGLWSGAEGDVVPQLSADGYTVAFIANARLVSRGANFGGGAGNGGDLYLANMHEGLTRWQALVALTELASGKEKIAADASIVDSAVSPDGRQVAFSTVRTEFPLGSPDYVSQPASVPGMAELFDVDLGDDTLTRVSGGYEGGPSSRPHYVSGSEDPYYTSGGGAADGALSPSFSDDGDLLAFSSTASNLVYGDGNTPTLGAQVQGSFDGSDAFVIPRKLFPPETVATYVSAPPASPPLVPPWALGATALSLPNGSVRLYVELPGAGSLTVKADSAVRVLASHARASKRGSHTSIHRGRASTVVERTVASAHRAIGAGASALVELTLTLGSSYRALASRTGGLSSTARIAFTAPGHPTLSQSVAISFRTKAKPSPARSSKRASKRSPRR